MLARLLTRAAAAVAEPRSQAEPVPHRGQQMRPRGALLLA